MKKLFIIALLVTAGAISAQEVKIEKPQVVEASCGQCNFGIKGKGGCDLAVRIDGKSYFVDGVHLDDHGDAHAADGFCSVVRKAEVTGAVEGGRFKAKTFQLLPEKEETKSKK